MSLTPNSEALGGGFQKPAEQSSHIFRALLEAMARPGQIFDVAGIAPPAPLSPAAGAVILTLCDPTTALFLAPAYDTAAVRAWIGFHTGAPITAAENAQFALGQWDMLQPISRFRLGEPSYPDRSVTLIVEMATLSAKGAVLRGPGIKDSAELSLPETAAFVQNQRLFPLGFDTIFTAGSAVAALPRSTKVEAC